MKQKRQFNVSKQVSKQTYTSKNSAQLVIALKNLQVKCDARGLVDSFDEMMLHSEKVRRTSIRVKVRTNHHRKRAALRLMREFIHL